MIISHRSNKSCFSLIICCQRYLMISLEGIQKAHSRMAYRCIHQLVYLSHREWVFRTSPVEICKVHTHPPFSCLLFHYHGIHQPLRVKYLFYSPCLFKFGYFTLDSLYMFLRGRRGGCLLGVTDRFTFK